MNINDPIQPMRYLTPKIKVIDLSPRRVLCSSPGSGETETPGHVYINDYENDSNE